MPIYEYVCQKCQHPFEAFLRSSTDQASCPKCEETRELKRVPSVFTAAAGGQSAPFAPPSGGGCMRCGDPNGPCAS